MANDTPKSAPIAMVETAFMASTTAMLFLINYYFPVGPLFRMFFPTPTALIMLRWGSRSAWKCVLVSFLLLSLLMGPTRSIQFLIPHGFLGVILGYLWKRHTSWAISLSIGTVISTLGIFFQSVLVSFILQENIWLYFTSQISQLVTSLSQRIGILDPPNLLLVQIVAIVLITLSSLMYQFLVHIAAWLLLDRLGNPIPSPPLWIEMLLL